MANSRLSSGTWAALALALLALAALSWWLGAAPAPGTTVPATTTVHAAPNPLPDASRAVGAPETAGPADSSEASHPDGNASATTVAGDATRDASAVPAWLPRDASVVLARIRRGGPYAFAKDGAVFSNRERRLPVRAYGSYHEYTVSAPGSRDRGARRIVCEGEPARACWYSRDHYRSFRRIPDALLAAP